MAHTYDSNNLPCAEEQQKNSKIEHNETPLPSPSRPAPAQTHPLTADRPAVQSESNPTTFVNFKEFHSDAGAFTPVDWEHVDRQSAGSSVIDTNSVYDDSGRSFHGYKEGKYFLPNDGAEQDRLDLQHAGLLLLLNGKLGRAPVQDPRFVLDIATGTGIWALDYAEQHPNTQVIGTDLSEIQPKWRFPNCFFIQDDAEEDEWLIGSSDCPIVFDYIHLRWVFTCFNNPRKVLQNAYKNLRPGGWVEYCDTSVDIESVDNNTADTAIKKWGDLFIKGMEMVGRDLRVPRYYAQWMREEGFVDVVEEVLMCPGNPWPENPRLKKCGQFMLVNTIEGVRGVGWKMFKHLGMSTDEIEEFIEEVKRDVRNPKYRWYWPVPFDWEIKPPTTFNEDNKSPNLTKD